MIEAEIDYSVFPFSVKYGKEGCSIGRAYPARPESDVDNLLNKVRSWCEVDREVSLLKEEIEILKVRLKFLEELNAKRA